jgi:hypothetical protein
MRSPQPRAHAQASLTVDGSEIDVANYEGGSLDFPFEVASGLQPEGSRVELRLEGYGGGQLLVTRTAATTVMSDRKILLEVALEDECIEVECGAADTCISGSCADPLRRRRPAARVLRQLGRRRTGDRCEPRGDPLVIVGGGPERLSPSKVARCSMSRPGAGGYHVDRRAHQNLRQRSVTEVRGVFPALDYAPPPLQVVFTFDPDEGDYCKLYGLRFRLDDADHPIESLLGETLELTVTVSDQDEDSAEASTSVVLSDEPP